MSRLSVCLLAMSLAWSVIPSTGAEPQPGGSQEVGAKPIPGANEAKPSAGAVTRLGKARFQNVGKVFSVAFSPDGKTLASAAWDGSICLWDPATGKELRQCVGHTGWVKAVAFSADGKTLASGGKDGDIHLWETANGKELRRLKGHRAWIQSLVLAANGKFLASKSVDGILVLWDGATGRELGRPPVQRNTSSSLAFSPDSRALAYASDISTISLWDVATGRELRHIRLPRSWFDAIAFSPDGKTMTAVSYFDRVIHLWDVSNAKELRPFGKLETFRGDGLTFSPDGKAVTCLEDYGMGGAAAMAADASAGGSGLGASARGGTMIHVREARTGQERCQLYVREGAVACSAFSPDGKVLAIGGNDITVLLWDLTGRLHQGQLQPLQLPAAELPTLWTELASDDAAKANRAIWKLVAAAEQSVPFFKEHLRPEVPTVDEHGLRQLVVKLDSNQFVERRKAMEQLEKLGEVTESVLRQTLQNRPSLETRQRVEQLLGKIESARLVPPPERLRELRALEVLEHIATPEAQKVLEALTKKELPDRELKQQAKASLERLGKTTASPKEAK